MMNSTVLWVDEDERIWATERNLLSGLGFRVVPISDATSALTLIGEEVPHQIHLIILDVMLLPGDDDITFSSEATDSDMDTGLVLARKIVEIDPEYGKRILFFSRATKPTHVAKIKAIASKIGGFYLQKSVDSQGKYFVLWLEKQGFLKEAPK
jgi:CheY-like chemotaxis protein